MRIPSRAPGRLFVLAVIALATGSTPARAADGYPVRPIRIVVPFTAGSAAGILARQLSARMTESWGQQMVVDDRPGAGGTIGAAIVAKATPDGYTLLVSSAAFAVSAAIYPKLPYDPRRDFAPISQIAAAPIILVAAPKAEARSVKALIALARQKPGQITFASSGVGSSTHFAFEQFRIAAGIDAVHVPYKGPAEALIDTSTGRTQYSLVPVVAALPFIKDGRLLALAVTTAQRAPMLPDVPTIAQAALPDYEYQDWWGVFGPAKTPLPVIDKVSGEIARIVGLPDMNKQLLSQGAAASPSTPAEFTRFVIAKIDNAAGLVRVAGIRVD